MARTAIWTALLVSILVVAVQPVRADFEAGQRAWDAGHLDEALTQWRAAADAGDRRAMLALGQRYLQGLGVLQDYVEAHMWFNLAASRGEAAALDERDAVAAKMTPQQVVAAQERAAAWRPTASESAGALQGTGTAESDAGPPPPRAIREAQELLASLGYAPGPADGVWGVRSARAYREFLRDAGLPAAQTLTPGALRVMRATAKRRGGREAMERRPAVGPRDAASEHPRASVPPAPVAQAGALHRAARTGDLRGLDAAIAAGADVDARGDRGWTALMHAVNNGYILLVDSLLAARANPDIRAPDGATAQFMAALHGHAEIFARLVEAGADTSIPGPQGRTAVEVAQLQGHSRLLALPEVVALLNAEAEHKQREEAKRRAEADSGAFSIAKSRDTPQAYKDYLSEWCPGGVNCSAARTRLDESVRDRISGTTFSGPLQNPGYDRLTLRFFPSGEFESHFHAWFGGAWPSGTWRVENGKVRMNFRAYFMDSARSVTSQFDGDVLVGRDPRGYGSWRLREVPVEEVVTKHRPTRNDSDGR